MPEQPEIRSGLDEFGRWHDAGGRIIVGWINPETGTLMRLPLGHMPYNYEPAWETVYGAAPVHREEGRDERREHRLD